MSGRTPNGYGYSGEIKVIVSQTTKQESPNMIINMLILSVTIFLVAELLPGIRVKNFFTAVIVAIVYSVINFFMGWLLVLLTLPFMIITFGLFKLVINAFLLWVTDKLMEDFEIKDFLTTFVAASLITLVDSLLKWVF